MPSTANISEDTSLYPDSDIDFFRKKIFQMAGISISPEKGEMIRSRIRKRTRDLQIETISEYRVYLEKLPKEHKEWNHFVNALTTNKTEWFREPAHFRLLEEEFLPKWLKQGHRTLKVWCAACSTGEEAYTLAIVLKNILPKGYNFEILASDIDTTTLWHAKNGVYKKASIDSIPEKYQGDFFNYGTDKIKEWVKVKKELKSHITFSRINLLDLREYTPNDFDIIFCRNVFIYFNRQTIEKITIDFHKACAENALLFVGHSESLQGNKNPFKYIKSSIYSKGALF